MALLALGGSPTPDTPVKKMGLGDPSVRVPACCVATGACDETVPVGDTT